MASTSNSSASPLHSRIEDTVRLCDKRNAPCFLGFLDEQEQAEARLWLSHRLSPQSYSFNGGHEEAERRILGVFPDYMEAQDGVYPLKAVAFHYRTVRKLTHRDFLGTLLSLGIRRETVGDILCGDGLSVVFLREEIASFVCEQVDKIGGEGIRITVDYDGELPQVHTFLPISETVASARLDAVVKALLHTSREEAATLIRTGLVSLNHQPVENVSAAVEAHCVISVRGSGRFYVDGVGPETKKGRLALQARKCI